MRFEIGTKVVGNWGAMIAHSYGTIVAKSPYVYGEYTILWEADDVEPAYCGYHEVYIAGYKTPNGSPIGVFEEIE